jgi:hypothetical protein
MRLLLAFRAFFSVLFNREVALRVTMALELPEKLTTTEAPAVAKPLPKPAPPPTCSEAIVLLAALQREARFVDFIQEPLANYTDAQIGAAAREVHRDCGKVLERLFQLKPVLAEVEGAVIDVPVGFDAGRFRIIGNVTGEPPFRGRVVHHGWEAAGSHLPAWSGSADAARVIAPAEVEL